MRNEELVHEEERDGFSVRLYLAPEDDRPDWHFETEEERQETNRKIDSGVWLWFVAHVTASRTPGGAVLGEDYLGGCCYSSVEEFIKPGDYYSDMVYEAVRQAQEAERQEALTRCFVG